MNKTFEKHSIASAQALSMVEAAMQKANELNIKVAVAVVDESGVLKAFARMDGAPLMAVDVCRRKALTAVGLGLPTGETWHEFIKDDPILTQGVQGIQDFMLLGGGSPLQLEGTLVGAIGVSGGHYKQDEDCAAAALSLLEYP